MKDIAFSVLDLLKQGLMVPDVLKRLKACHAIARAQHDTLRSDLLETFHCAIQHCACTEQWVRFHVSEPVGRTGRANVTTDV